MGKVVIRTHGGLGNQIFQIFYAKIVYENEPIIFHDNRYPHNFRLSKSFERYFSQDISLIDSAICKSRFVKLIEKFTTATPILKLGSTHFLDGYFQKNELYSAIPASRISDGIKTLRNILKIDANPLEDSLCHIRLSDFFKSDDERVEAARNRLLNLEKGTHFISSSDHLISDDQECQRLIVENNLVHIDTNGFSGEDVLLLMSKYKKIKSNNSTLAFWAAVFNNSQLVIDDKNLNILFDMLTKVDDQA